MLLGPVLQLAYVTNDIDGACAHLGARYGLHKFLRSGPNTLETDAGALLTLKLAHAWLGPTWYEVIQPMDEAPPFLRDWVPAGGPALRLHHIGIRLPDLAAWERMLRGVEAAGYRVPLMLTKNRAQKYCYVDMTAELGHYVEYLFVPDPMQSMMANIPQNIEGFVGPAWGAK